MAEFHAAVEPKLRPSKFTNLGGPGGTASSTICRSERTAFVS